MLRDHDLVHVAGVGLTPDGVAEVQQCALDFGVCRATVSDAEVETDGTIALDLEVRRFITHANTVPVDCALVSCVVLVEQFGEEEILVTSPLHFDPAAPASPIPTVSVTPDMNLPFEATVSVAGHHFEPGENVVARQCGFDISGTCRNLGTTAADATGCRSTRSSTCRPITSRPGRPSPPNSASVRRAAGLAPRGCRTRPAIST